MLEVASSGLMRMTDEQFEAYKSKVEAELASAVSS